MPAKPPRSQPGRNLGYKLPLLSSEDPMLFLLSPAKSLDYATPLSTTLAHSQMLFTTQSAALHKVLRRQSPQQIAELLTLVHAL